jgi:hypothetical protein
MDELALFIQMNDLIVQQGVVITVVWRHGANAAVRTLRGTEISTWDSTLWNLPNWYRQA